MEYDHDVIYWTRNTSCLVDIKTNQSPVLLFFSSHVIYLMQLTWLARYDSQDSGKYLRWRALQQQFTAYSAVNHYLKASHFRNLLESWTRPCLHSCLHWFKGILRYMLQKSIINEIYNHDDVYLTGNSSCPVNIKVKPYC